MTTAATTDPQAVAELLRKRNRKNRAAPTRSRDRLVVGSPDGGVKASDRQLTDPEDIKAGKTAAEATRHHPAHRALLGDGKPKPVGRKADDFVQLLRIKQAVNMIVQGATRQQANDWLCKQHNIGKRHADRYLRAAREEIVAQWEIERPEMLATLMSQSLHVYHNSISAGQNGTALSSLQFQSRLVKLT